MAASLCQTALTQQAPVQRSARRAACVARSASKPTLRSYHAIPGGTRRDIRVCASRTGGSVVDSPLVLPGQELGKDVVHLKPPTYKVMLHNDNYNRREYVVKVLLKTVEGISMNDAVTVMQEAHETGVAMVIACPQEDAERYCEGLRLNGLTSTIEPGR